MLHLPCNAGVSDPAAPHGPCHCCDLQLDAAAVGANPQVPAGQVWVFLIGDLLFLCWLLFLAKAQARGAGAVGVVARAHVCGGGGECGCVC